MSQHPAALDYAQRIHELIAVDRRCGFALYKAQQNMRTGDFGYIKRSAAGQIESWTRMELSKSGFALATPKPAPGGVWLRIEDGRELSSPRAGWESY
jgi:hypothetical protein